MRRSIVLIVALGFLLSGMAFADSDPAPPSNTADITGGIFEEANDLFLSPTGFGDLESDVLFLQFDMPSGVVSPQGFEIGGTTMLSDMYVGVYLNCIVPGSTGQLGGNDSVRTDIDQSFLVEGGTGAITGKTESRTNQVDYNMSATNDVRALIGLGPMGIGLRVNQSSTTGRGTYTPNYTFPGGTNWNGIGVGTGAATSSYFSTFDAVGGLVSVNSDTYGLGKDCNGVLEVTASFGMPLNIGEDLALDIGADLLVGMWNNDETAVREQFTRVVGSGTAIAYTPAQTADGSDPIEIPDLTSYTWTEAMEGNSYLQIEPSVSASVEMPLKDGVLAVGGVDLGVAMPLYGSKYADNAGVDQKVSGLADSYYQIDVLPELNTDDPSLIETTTTTISSWETQDIGQVVIDLDLAAGFEMTPSERFRFGVVYQPMLSLDIRKDSYAGEAVRMEIYENGDGVDGPEDYVDRDTTSRSGYTVSTTSLTVTNVLNTAAQFFLKPDRIRVNLGAQIDNVMMDRTLTETVTDGIAEYTTESSVGTADPGAATFVVDSYTFNQNVRANPDDEQDITLLGSSSVTYDAGFTFFFDENMFLDLRMDATGGDIWSTNEWSLEMTILY